MSRATDLIELLGLEPHPEGGYYREVFRSGARVVTQDERGPRAALTTIFFLLERDTHSRWHRVLSDEVWHLYEGGPLELLEMDLGCFRFSRRVLGAPTAESSPVHTLAAGKWQAARPLGDYVLVGCTVAPGFEFADFTMLADDPAAAALVRERWPDLADLI